MVLHASTGLRVVLWLVVKLWKVGGCSVIWGGVMALIIEWPKKSE